MVLRQGQTETVILTLNEKMTLPAAYFLIVFISQTSKETVKFVLPDDISSSPERYNSFEIVVNDYFSTKPVGFWDYTVYEQISSTNTDPTLSTGIVEQGIMELKGSSFSYTGRDFDDSEIKYHNPS